MNNPSNTTNTTDAPDLRELGDRITEAILDAQDAGTDERAAAAPRAAALGVELPDDLLALALEDWGG